MSCEKYTNKSYTGKEIAKYQEGVYPRKVSFSPTQTGKLLVSYYGYCVLIDFPPLQQLIDETRERFKNRQLTPEERREYYLE